MYFSNANARILLRFGSSQTAWGNAQGRDSGMHVSIRLISAEVRAGSSCLQINHIDRLSHILRMGTG